MPFTTVPDKATGDVFTEQMWDAYIRDNLNSGSVRPISDTILGSTATQIDLTSIPASWNALWLLIYARGDAAATVSTLSARFNGDTGANYDTEQILGQGGGTTSASESIGASSASIGNIPAGTAPANTFGAMAHIIPFYTNTALQKTIIGKSAEKHGTAAGTITTRTHCAEWRSTAAINRITILISAGNMVAGTRATLYGVGGLV